MTSRELIEKAIRAKKAEFMAQQDTLSIKHVRRIIEQDLGLEKKSLDQQKDVVAELIDKIMFQDAAAEDADRLPKPQQKAVAKPKGPAAKAANGSKKRAKQEPDGMDEHTTVAAIDKSKGVNRTAASKPAKKRKISTDSDNTAAGSDSGTEAVHKKAGARKPKAAAPAGSKHGPRVQKLQQICRGAGITIPPNMYKKNPDPAALEEALKSLLAKHQLSAKSDAQAIARVKAKLEMQRDMEGIDLSNIIDDDDSGRGRRPRRAAAQVDFRRILKQSESDDDDDNEQEQGNDVEESDSDSELAAVDSEEEGGSKRIRPKAAATSNQHRRPDRKHKAASGGSESEDDSGSESDGVVGDSESEAQDTDDNELMKQKKQVKQPRQNVSNSAAEQRRKPAKTQTAVQLSSEGARDSIQEDSSLDKPQHTKQPGTKAAQKSAAKQPIMLADDDDDDKEEEGEGLAGRPAAAKIRVAASAVREQLKAPSLSEKWQHQSSSDVEEGLADIMEASEGNGQPQPLPTAAPVAKRTKNKAVVLSSDDEEIREEQEEEENQQELQQESEEEEESDFEAVEDDD